MPAHNQTRARLSTVAGISAVALAVFAVMLAATVLPGTAQSASRSHSCGQLGSSAGWGYGDIRAHGLSCHAARRVILHWSPDHTHGWRLNQNRTPQVFSKGGKWITGYALGD